MAQESGKAKKAADPAFTVPGHDRHHLWRGTTSPFKGRNVEQMGWNWLCIEMYWIYDIHNIHQDFFWACFLLIDIDLNLTDWDMDRMDVDTYNLTEASSIDELREDVSNQSNRSNWDVILVRTHRDLSAYMFLPSYHIQRCITSYRYISPVYPHCIPIHPRSLSHYEFPIWVES